MLSSKSTKIFLHESNECVCNGWYIHRNDTSALNKVEICRLYHISAQ